MFNCLQNVIKPRLLSWAASGLTGWRYRCLSPPFISLSHLWHRWSPTSLEMEPEYHTRLFVLLHPRPPVSYISSLFSILSTSVLVQTHLSYFSSLLSGLPVSNRVVIKSTLHISARHSIFRLFGFAFYTLVTLNCWYLQFLSLSYHHHVPHWNTS